MLTQQLRKPEHHLPTLVGSGGAPGGQRSTRRLDRQVDFPRPGEWNLSSAFAGRAVHMLEDSAGGVVDALVADEQTRSWAANPAVER